MDQYQLTFQRGTMIVPNTDNNRSVLLNQNGILLLTINGMSRVVKVFFCLHMVPRQNFHVAGWCS